MDCIFKFAILEDKVWHVREGAKNAIRLNGTSQGLPGSNVLVNDVTWYGKPNSKS